MGKRRNLEIVAVLVALGLCAPAGGRIIYVDGRAVGANNGSTWIDAHWCLQDALANAQPYDEIRVAKGPYRPDCNVVMTHGPSIAASSDRRATFQLADDVTIRGGYAGYNEPDPNVRDTELFASILSGDLDGDDVRVTDPGDLLNEPSRAENSYQVVTGNGTGETAVLDGFTIVGGNANVYTNRNGGGLLNEYGSPLIANCTFMNNTASSFGGAMYNYYSSPRLLNCTFVGNYSEGGGTYSYQSNPSLVDCKFIENSSRYGGGMYNVKSSVSVEECEFIGNSAHQGGAIYNDESDATIADCVFTENLADDNGGALYAFRNRPYLENCVFIMNSADYGGGAVCFHDSDPNLTNCTFRENSADYGGGMYNMGSDPVLTNCLFMANSGHGYGGGMYNTDSNPMLNNCLMTANRAYSYGGALSCNNSDLTVTNCTFTENSAPKGTSIAFNSRDQRGRSTAGLIACIIWDGAEAFWINDRSGIAISYSNIQGGWPGEGNIDADPLFVDADGPDHIPGTQDDDFRLAPLSPCIDAGDPSYAPEPNKKDLDGNPRIVGGRVDVGTYEFRGIIYVGSDVSDNPFRYGTEDNPFGSIQQAIDIAKDGHTVMVKPGVYGKIDFRGKAITVTGAEGAAVIEEPWNGRGGDPKPDAVTFHTGEGSASVLKNFIIKDAGMAISLNSGSSPTMRNLTIVDNDFGIAAYENSNPDISNCIFWNNRDGDLFQCTARFSSLEGGAEGEGNITVNPLFVEEAGGDYHSDGDYHLKSEGHRWDQDAQIWIYDRVTSRCIDAGDPACPLGDEPMSVPRDADNEFGINRRINMGAFGGTAQASMPPLDLVSPEYETVAPGPNPALWALNGTPHEAPGASGTWGYRWVQMTAAEATDNSGWVEYFFDCTTQSELSSGWQYSRDYEVRVGGPGLGHRFRVKTRDLFGNETGWSELLEAK